MQNNEAKSTARSRVICAYYTREHKKAKHVFLDQTCAAQSHVIWWLIPVPAANVIPNLGSSTHVEPPLSGAGSNQIFVGRHRPRATCIQKWCQRLFPRGYCPAGDVQVLHGLFSRKDGGSSWAAKFTGGSRGNHVRGPIW